MKRNTITRKGFLKKAGWFLTLPILYIFGKAVDKEIRNGKTGQSIVTGPFPEGITFYDRFILVKKGSRITVYANRCTHLGCRINQVESGRMQCPCHGSMFDTEGHPVQGPAYKPLQKLRFHLEENRLTVFLI